MSAIYWLRDYLLGFMKWRRERELLERQLTDLQDEINLLQARLKQKDVELQNAIHQLELSELKQESEAREYHHQLELSELKRKSEVREHQRSLSQLEKDIKILNDSILSMGRLGYSFEVLICSRTHVTHWYDSTWAICFVDNGRIGWTTITRRDGQTFDLLIQDLRKCKSIENVRGLDLREEIYYD